MSAEVASQGSAQQPCYRKQRCDSSFATSILWDNWGEARSQPNPRQTQTTEHLQAWVRAAWAQILPGKGKKLMRGGVPAANVGGALRATRRFPQISGKIYKESCVRNAGDPENLLEPGNTFSLANQRRRKLWLGAHLGLLLNRSQ